MSENTQKKLITVTAVEDSYFHVYSSYADFVDRLNKVFAKVPAEYLDSTWVEIDATSNYGEPSVKLAVTYSRPETPSEQRRRERQENATSQSIMRDKMAILERLAKDLGVEIVRN